MKAKAYFQTYVAVQPKQINGIVFSKMLSDMFSVFFEELKAAVKPLQQLQSQMSKFREYDKKWVAIAKLAQAHFELPENHRRPHNDELSMIDRHDLEAMEQLFQAWIQDRHPEIHRLLHETFVARDRLQQQARPRFVTQQDDLLWRGLLAVCRGF